MANKVTVVTARDDFIKYSSHTTSLDDDLVLRVHPTCNPNWSTSEFKTDSWKMVRAGDEISINDELVKEG